MRYFDLHCDTAVKCADSQLDFYDNKLAVSAAKLEIFDRAVQTYAVYINSEYTGEAAYERFEQIYEYFDNARKKGAFGDVYPMLSIENLECINGDVDNIERFASYGVRIASLTWNGENSLGGGVGSDKGLSALGREAVKRCERCGITVDVSHANRQTFFDIASTAAKPFIATHSDSYEICRKPRNLTDEQFRLVAQSGGFSGINLYPEFVGKRRRAYGDILAHITHFLELGGEKSVALGTDFDGAEMDSRFESVADMPPLYKYLCKRLTNHVADRIFFDNCNEFFEIF